jgi:hypothetical protein
MNLHLTTSELIEKYPELKTRFNWTRKNLSFFMRSKLLIGYYNRNKRTTMIKESSLLELIEFTKEILNEQLLIQ